MIQDVFYVVLRNFIVGYIFDLDWISNIGLSLLCFYFVGINLFYFMGDDYILFNLEGVEIINGGYLGLIIYGV